MDCSNCDMQCIGRRVGRDTAIGYQRFGQLLHLVVYGQLGNAMECFQSSSGRFRIAR